jgi:hypothetical protein
VTANREAADGRPLGAVSPRPLATTDRPSPPSASNMSCANQLPVPGASLRSPYADRLQRRRSIDRGAARGSRGTGSRTTGRDRPSSPIPVVAPTSGQRPGRRARPDRWCGANGAIRALADRRTFERAEAEAMETGRSGSEVLPARPVSIYEQMAGLTGQLSKHAPTWQRIRELHAERWDST